MSYNEVKILRKEGRLDESLKLALEDLEKDSSNIWNKRSISWVYYGLLKKEQEQNNRTNFLLQLKNIKDLSLPQTETMVFDSCAWSIGKYLFNNKELDSVFLNTVFDIIKSFSFTKKTDSYSYLLKSFRAHSINWGQFIDFTKWWGLDNFQDKDFENYILDNGKAIPSLAEGIYVSISKQLLGMQNTKLIKEFIPTIATIATNYSNMQYPPYYYAKLLIAIGDKKHFMDAFLPFAKKKQRDFWVWNLISENFDKDSEEYFSCICKSLTCGAPDKFTGEVRDKLANVLISKNKYAEAKHEMLRIIVARKKEGWRLKDKHLKWQNFDWWENTDASKNNSKLYEANIGVAESLLFANLQEEIVVIERVNKEKSVINFVVSKEKSGFASYRKLKAKPKEGDVYAVRFMEKTDEKSNFYVILAIRECNKLPDSSIYKEVQGNIVIKQTNSFGFLNNVFVPPHIISEEKLKNNDIVKTIAINKYNQKRKSWGWNVIKII